MHEPSRGRRVPIAGESRGIGAYLCPVSDALSVYVTGQVIEVNGGQSMNPSTADLLEAVEATSSAHVIILPNNPNIVAVAKQVDSQTSKSVCVVETNNVTEGFASLLGYDPAMKGFSSENLDLAFQVWMCNGGGRNIVIPCSHVGHVFRDKSPSVSLKLFTL